MNKLLVAAATVCFVFSLTVSAQTSAAAPQSTQPQEISPEKRALLKELFEAVGTKKQATEILNALEAEMSKQMVEMSWEKLSDMPQMKVLTDAERQELKRQLSESSARQYTRMMESLTHRIDYGQLIEDVSTVVYAKYFNEKELKDLLAFYKSDTGQHSLQIMPHLLTDSFAEISNRLTPVMNDVVREIAADDTNKLRDQVTALAKAHHRQTTSKRKAN